MAMTKIQLTAAEAAYAKNPNIGRRNLIRACGCTGYAASRYLQAKHAGHPVGTTKDASGDALAGARRDDAAPLRGFAVGVATRMTAKKPVVTLRARFFQLKRGMAYRIEDVARDWVVSAETLRRHALDADCFRYIETGNETWEPCVMHPDTAKQYPCK